VTAPATSTAASSESETLRIMENLR
jgi:hypothetical protein